MSDKDIMKLKDVLLLLSAVVGVLTYAFSFGVWYNTTEAYGKMLDRHEDKIVNLEHRANDHDLRLVEINKDLDYLRL